MVGPPRPVEVVAATPHAVYLATGDPDLPALCLAGPAAVRVPCALVLARAPGRLAGPARVGGGAVSVGGFRARLARWWRPPRPAAVKIDVGRVELDPRVEAAVPALTAALSTALSTARSTVSPLEDAVAGLLGRGPGLTPLGDDVLAGALVALAALRASAFERLAATVRALAPARTTFVSAALLHHAARGECVPELAAALAGRGVGPLLALGATSGAGLLRGVQAVLP